jgi:hypothetical protein
VLALATVLATVVAVALHGPAGAACTPSHDLQQALTLLAPALALLAPLLLGRYLGAERIVRAAAARRARGRRRAPARAPRAVARPRAELARGGALIAAALARRGPPVLHIA